MVPALGAAATSSGGGMRKQPVNLVHGVPDELASSTCISSASDTVASSMSIVSTRLSRGLISHANLMPMATSRNTSTNTGNVTNVSSVNTLARRLAKRVYFSREFNANGY